MSKNRFEIAASCYSDGENDWKPTNLKLFGVSVRMILNFPKVCCLAWQKYSLGQKLKSFSLGFCRAVVIANWSPLGLPTFWAFHQTRLRHWFAHSMMQMNVCNWNGFTMRNSIISSIHIIDDNSSSNNNIINTSNRSNIVTISSNINIINSSSNSNI